MPTLELHQFASDWHLPNPSPFCLKIGTWLRMAGLEHTIHPWNPMKAPNGKAPFVVVDGEVIPDSTRIVQELTARFGVTLDEGMTAHERALALLVQRTLEEHTYWAVLHNRWVDDAGFRAYVPVLSAALPGPVPGLMAHWLRRGVRTAAHAQGLARHPPAEIHRRAIADLDAVAEVLGDGPYLLGATPRSIDATVYAFVAQAQAPEWTDPVAEHARTGPWPAYTQRMRERYWAS